MKNLSSWNNSLAKRFACENKAVASIEFALLVPILLLLLLFLIDMHTYMNSQRKVKELTLSLSRTAASFPAYDSIARMSINRTLVGLEAYFPEDGVRVEILSAEYKNGHPSQVFGPVKLSSDEDTDIDWAENFDRLDYRPGEQIIMVLARVDVPLLLTNYFGANPTATSVAQTQAYYTRPYTFLAGRADVNYYNTN